MNFEQAPQSNKGKESPPSQEFFGENVFEVGESGELKLASPDIKVEKPEKQKEIPPDVLDEAEEFGKAKAFIGSRNSKEFERVKEEAKKEYFKMKGY